MSRSRSAVIFLIQLLALPLTAQTPGSCSGTAEARADFGIRGVECVGPAAACAINVGDEGKVHQFSVEPAIVALSQLATDLEVGDVLVAVDDRLITTREGGAHLARIRVGQTISLLARRGGQLLEHRIEARPGCGLTSLSVTRGRHAKRHPGPEQSPEPI